jgi:uncharacterized protein YjiS (DUF1127 family)
MSCGSTTCTSPKSDSSATRPFSALDWSVPNPFSVLGKIEFMHERWRQRQHLLALDDRLLADIGLSRREALREARKLFWR